MEANIIIMGLLVVILFGGVYLSIITKRLYIERKKISIMLKEKRELEEQIRALKSNPEKVADEGGMYFSH